MKSGADDEIQIHIPSLQFVQTETLSERLVETEVSIISVRKNRFVLFLYVLFIFYTVHMQICLLIFGLLQTFIVLKTVSGLMQD
jgi:hypothetical protein